MRIRLTLLPGRRGTKKLLDRYGKQLVCVRYRYDTERKKRLKTVELIVEEVDWEPKQKPAQAQPLRITQPRRSDAAAPEDQLNIARTPAPASYPSTPTTGPKRSRLLAQQDSMTAPTHPATVSPTSPTSPSPPTSRVSAPIPIEQSPAPIPPIKPGASSSQWPTISVQGLRPRSLVGVRVAYGEYGLHWRLRQTGATWDSRRQLWITTYGKVIIMDLLDRMVRLDE